MTNTTGSEHEEDQVEEVLEDPMNVDNGTPNQDSTGSTLQNGHGDNKNVTDNKLKEKDPELHNTDIKTIVHFFAYTPDDMTDDDVLWAAITEAVRVPSVMASFSELHSHTYYSPIAHLQDSFKLARVLSAEPGGSK